MPENGTYCAIGSRALSRIRTYWPWYSWLCVSVWVQCVNHWKREGRWYLVCRQGTWEAGVILRTRDQLWTAAATTGFSWCLMTASVSCIQRKRGGVCVCVCERDLMRWSDPWMKAHGPRADRLCEKNTWILCVRVCARTHICAHTHTYAHTHTHSHQLSWQWWQSQLKEREFDCCQEVWVLFVALKCTELTKLFYFPTCSMLYILIL